MVQGSTSSNSTSVPPEVESPPCPPWTCELEQDSMEADENLPRESNDVSTREVDDSSDELLADRAETATSEKSLDILNEPVSTINRVTVWGRTPVSILISLHPFYVILYYLFELVMSIPAPPFFSIFFHSGTYMCIIILVIITSIYVFC